jgi:hypothetical protein
MLLREITFYQSGFKITLVSPTRLKNRSNTPLSGLWWEGEHKITDNLDNQYLICYRLATIIRPLPWQEKHALELLCYPGLSSNVNSLNCIASNLELNLHRAENTEIGNVVPSVVTENKFALGSFNWQFGVNQPHHPST